MGEDLSEQVKRGKIIQDESNENCIYHKKSKAMVLYQGFVL